jgi:ABC-2 type transport system permease protein
MFLSGTFFPVASFPPWLQGVAHVLPLYYVIDGLDQAMLFGNWSRAGLDLGIVLVASIVVFVLAIRLFKWRDS